MNDLIQQIVQRTGLPEEKVQQVVGMVMDHVKGRLPDSVSGQLEGLLSGGSATGGGNFDSAKSGLGDMLGRNS
ncbi:MAG: hypothetical protein ACRD2D_06580 [Terriglobales bacterium]